MRYIQSMNTVKQSAIKAIQNLPENSSYEDIMEKLFFMEKVESGLKEIEEGKTISHEDVKKRLSKWLK
jgi:predicted transcriptional regulator